MNAQKLNSLRRPRQELKNVYYERMKKDNSINMSNYLQTTNNYKFGKQNQSDLLFNQP